MIKSQTITENGYEVVFTGIVTSKEMFEIGADFKRHPEFNAFKYILMWFAEIENMIIDVEELQQLAKLDRVASEQNPQLRFAVATDSPLVFGLARMWQAFYGDGPWEPTVFKKLEDARKWVYSGR